MSAPAERVELSVVVRDDPSASRPTRLVALVHRPTGTTGWGEAAPIAGYCRDTDAEVRAALAPLATVRLDVDAPPVAAVDAALASLGPALARSPAARFALETALLDLRAQLAGIGVASLLAGASAASASVATSVVVRPRDDTAEVISRLRAGRFAAAKVKLASDADGGFRRSLRVLGALRAAFGDAFELRLDANGAWSLAEARERLDELAALGLSFVEEPTRTLAELGPTATPWAADESLQPTPGSDTEATARRLLAEPSCAALVLKPHALGGSLRAAAVARLARAAGRRVVVTHMFDGPVALAAACELALSLGPDLAACGLDPHDARTAALPQLATRGRVVGSGRSGLGVAPEAA